MKDLVNSTQKELENFRAVLLGTSLKPNRPPSMKTRLEWLDKIFNMLKYISTEDPGQQISVDIIIKLSNLINNLDTRIKQFGQSSTQDKFNDLINNIDELHNYCLNFQLFSLSSEPETYKAKEQELSNIINLLNAKISDSEELLSKHEPVLAEKSKEALSKLDKEKNNLLKQISDQSALIIQKSNEFQNIIGEATRLLDNIKAKDKETADLKEIIVKAKNTSQNISNELSTILTESNQHVGAINANLAQTNNSSAAAAAKLQEIQNVLSGAQEKQKVIDGFYSEIGKNKKEIADLKNATTDDLEKHKENTKNLLDDFESRTKTILVKNESYQGNIKELLAGATSAGLFREFEDRSGKIKSGKKTWLLLLIFGVAITIGSILAIPAIFDSTNMVMFFVRFSLLIPCGFWIWFSTAQYSKERKLEEEYAFKSAISLSLGPYRELLQKMEAAKNEETSFVKKLMLEAFKNPNRRGIEADSGFRFDTFTLAARLKKCLAIVDKITDPDKNIKILTESLGEILNELSNK